MSRAHYWLLLQVAKAPKAFTYGAGVLIAMLLVAATAITVFVVDRAHTTQQHDQAARLSQAMAAEIIELLDRFGRYRDISCEGSDLMHLNSHLLRARFVREVGILDADSRLLCTTSMGRLPKPIKGNHPVISLPSGREMLIDVPLQVTDKAVKATIFRQGDFNVVVGPHVTEELYTSADYIWLRTASGLALIRSVQAPPDDVQQQILEDGGATDQSTWSLHSLGYTQLTAPADTVLIFQTRRDWISVMTQNSTLLIGMLIGSILFSVLAASALAPHILQLCGVHNRVRFLCDEDHIQLVYQPIFDLRSNQPVGCEVLMRIHEDKRIWMPDQLIPAILNSGLTRRYDHVVASKAISELASHLPVQKHGFKITLNFFPESIDRGTLVPLLQDALQRAGRNDFQLCIEVTEHSLSSKLIAETNSLKAQGFLIAIDDFGTGYSNLKSVTMLSPDLLKIDKSFVFELEDVTLRSTIIPQIVNIARAVEAQIIAEGIEKLEQVPLLAAMGVQYGQGYALARPMDLQAFLAFMSKGFNR
ncbi:MAG: EAL domain-containing protein [Burkholderiaceae bacterium]|nr:EAL domain-containing protein [Burkholderiaceae bacterium]